MPYVPSEPHSIENVEQLRLWVRTELIAIARELGETTALELRPVFVEPVRPRDGMIIYADGTEFDPGAGEGVYERRAGAWVKL